MLIIRRVELLGDGNAIRVVHIFEHLTPKGTLTNRCKSCLEISILIVPTQPRELGLKALQIPKGVFIDNAHQAVELQEGVLQRGRCEEYLGSAGNRLFDRICDLVGGFIDIP